jgi:polysaccharide export outer membrane protein
VITVTSQILDQARVAQFNLPIHTFLGPGEKTIQQAAALQTYTVDPQGDINFPVVGKIRVAGLTRSQVKDIILQKVSKYLPDPIINLQIIQFRVTVLGEVRRPGAVEASSGRLSILDAIGAAEDLTIYGNRQNIKLIRDNNGVKSYHTFDLTSSDIFNSPYYYLQQNDVIIVEPNNTRKKESKFGMADNYRLSLFSITLSALSIIVTSTVSIIALSR